MKPAFSRMALLFFVAVPTIALGCLWDYDTLLQERTQFPKTLEVMTGKFYRHTSAFYQWRIEDRHAKLKANPDVESYWDDLAVAHSKLKHFDDAIRIATERLAKNPNRYETLSNLGTFYILSGELKKGLPFIDRALQVNPEAHFGREKYQKLLVEYVLSLYPDGKIQFPICTISIKVGVKKNFRDFLEQQSKDIQPNQLELEAVQAVLGMMRFADHDNPLLLEVLGDLLHAEDVTGAKRLACRAYLLAAEKMTVEPAKAAYLKKAEEALDMQVKPNTDNERVTLAEIQAELQQEQIEANLWYQKYSKTEQQWLDQGGDVDAEFQKLLQSQPEALIETVSPESKIRLLGQSSPIFFTLSVVIPCLLLVGAFVGIRTLLKSKD